MPLVSRVLIIGGLILGILRYTYILYFLPHMTSTVSEEMVSKTKNYVAVSPQNMRNCAYIESIHTPQSIPKRPSNIFLASLYSRSMTVMIAAAELLSYN